MFKKKSLLVTSGILAIAIVIFSGHVAHAQMSEIVRLFGLNLWDFVAEFFAIISTTVLNIMTWWVYFTGMLLNVSIILTLHIKEFVQSTPGIYLVWQTIRDISGIFIIFMLLFASFRIILGYDAKIGDLIKNIVIAGILINFSFFITSVLIDASNVVSLALYSGIVASPTQVVPGSTSTQSIVDSTMNSKADGGLSSILLEHLKPQSIYDPKNTSDTTQAGKSKPFAILLQGIVGSIIMFTTGLSFMLAALAFVARLVILIVLLAFSPIWFASMVVPQLKAKSKEWTDKLSSQLIFMPLYLLLLYAALRILTTSSIFTAPSGNVFTGSGADLGFIPKDLIVLVINDFFIIFMLNLPLVVGLTWGGHFSGLIKKFDAGALWKKMGIGAGSQLGSRTLGRAAYSANESAALKRLSAFSPLAGGLASKGLSSVSKNGFGTKKGGYEDRLKAKKEAQDKMHKRIGDLDRSRYATEEAYLAAKKAAGDLQASYRQNLPWRNLNGKPGGVIGFLLDNRGNRQTAQSLTDEADLDTNRDLVKGVDASIKYLEKRAAVDGGTTMTNAEKVELSQLKKQKTELEAAIKRGSGSKKKKDTSEAMKQIAKAAKEEGELGEEGKPSGGGEEKKDDKK